MMWGIYLGQVDRSGEIEELGCGGQTLGVEG
jgi:hypothetical protein